MSRFTLVGIVAACVHISIVWTLITQLGVEVLLANLIAFLTAFLISFSGQYWWTFRSKRNLRSALMRFFIISLSAFVLNNVVLITLLDLEIMPDAITAMLSACVIPVFTYIAGRFWAFR